LNMRWSSAHSNSCFCSLRGSKLMMKLKTIYSLYEYSSSLFKFCIKLPISL
jgi:hypothetical protein